MFYISNDIEKICREDKNSVFAGFFIYIYFLYTDINIATFLIFIIFASLQRKLFWGWIHIFLAFKIMLNRKWGFKRKVIECALHLNSRIIPTATYPMVQKEWSKFIQIYILIFNVTEIIGKIRLVYCILPTGCCSFANRKLNPFRLSVVFQS